LAWGGFLVQKGNDPWRFLLKSKEGDIRRFIEKNRKRVSRLELWEKGREEIFLTLAAKERNVVVIARIGGKQRGPGGAFPGGKELQSSKNENRGRDAILP